MHAMKGKNTSRWGIFLWHGVHSKIVSIRFWARPFKRVALPISYPINDRALKLFPERVELHISMERARNGATPK